MKNITVSLDDETYRRARVKAAEANTSVSALVKQYLTQLAVGESRFERLMRLEEETRAQIKNFRAGDRLTRDEVHERHR
jgi:plasmid stability protein